MRRLLSALFSLWFAIVLGDPGVLHSCAMHGGGHGTHGASGAATAHGGMSHGMSHDMSGLVEHQAPTDSPAPATCTCVGHCCATTATAPIPLRPAIEIPTIDAPRLAPRVAAVVVPPGAPDHRLPFANGPPAA
jgi:hypothetical protein